MAHRMTTLAMRQPLFLDPDPGHSRLTFLRGDRKPAPRVLRLIPRLAAGIVVGAVMTTGAYLAVSGKFSSSSAPLPAASASSLTDGASNAVR